MSVADISIFHQKLAIFVVSENKDRNFILMDNL